MDREGGRRDLLLSRRERWRGSLRCGNEGGKPSWVERNEEERNAPGRLTSPSLFWVRKSVRGTVKVQYWSHIPSNANWCTKRTWRMLDVVAGQKGKKSHIPAVTSTARIVKSASGSNASIATAKMGTSPRVKKKFQCTPYSETCSCESKE